MPWLPMYLVKDDLDYLSAWLSSEADIAIIVSVGKGKWQAKNDINLRNDGRYCLFHKSCGPLPLLTEKSDGEDEEVLDPFAGWKENRAGADSSTPYFGAGHPAIFWLNVRMNKNNIIGMSSFEWIGNHYSAIDIPAPDRAKKWWGRLSRWVKKNTTKIPRNGPVDGDSAEIWTFSCALREINSGVNRNNSP